MKKSKKLLGIPIVIIEGLPENEAWLIGEVGKGKQKKRIGFKIKGVG